jgi:hypothetical protein
MTLLAAVAFLTTLAANAPAIDMPRVSTIRTGQSLVPHMVEFARGSGTPVGPAAPGGLYCFAPIAADGEPDFTRARAYGSVDRAVALTQVTLRKADAATQPGLIGKKQIRQFTAAKDADTLFFDKPVTADEFCQLAKTKFETNLLAWNLF